MFGTMTSTEEVSANMSVKILSIFLRFF
jgi:hypothetical protein